MVTIFISHFRFKASTLERIRRYSSYLLPAGTDVCIPVTFVSIGHGYRFNNLFFVQSTTAVTPQITSPLAEVIDVVGLLSVILFEI